jgi:uncharacterized protein
VTLLVQIQDEVRGRCEAIAAAHGDWPCRNGCDDCCRHLASVPRITREEWMAIASAIAALPAGIAESVRQRIRESTGMEHPVVCPLLDEGSGACLVYESRPIACRAYGFYAERGGVLGCGRIESISREAPEVVWGNHAVVEGRMEGLGPAAELFVWLA